MDSPPGLQVLRHPYRRPLPGLPWRKSVCLKFRWRLFYCPFTFSLRNFNLFVFLYIPPQTKTTTESNQSDLEHICRIWRYPHKNTVFPPPVFRNQTEMFLPLFIQPFKIKVNLLPLEHIYSLCQEAAYLDYLTLNSISQLVNLKQLKCHYCYFSFIRFHFRKHKFN